MTEKHRIKGGREHITSVKTGADMVSCLTTLTQLTGIRAVTSPFLSNFIGSVI